MRSADVNAVLREIQTLREDLVLVLADRVKMERTVREVVREPANRETVFSRRRRPSYLYLDDVLRDLEAMRRLAYLVIPGRRNRIRPDVLLRRYQDKVTAVQDVLARLEALEEAARQAGIDLDVLPEDY